MSASDEQPHSLLLDFGPLEDAEDPAEWNAPSSTRPALDGLYVVDWCASLLLMVLTLPICLLGLLWVAVVARGNPLFSQVRIGLDGRPFRIYKIRSMSHDRHGHARFCERDDERILPGGQFLRKTRIDELPQFLNVLLGDMALVGPRPEQPRFVQAFLSEIPRYEERLRVKPGITGLAQVTQGYVDSVDGTRIKVAYDLEYLEKRSFRLWCAILLATVKVVSCQHGAR